MLGYFALMVGMLLILIPASSVNLRKIAVATITIGTFICGFSITNIRDNARDSALGLPSQLKENEVYTLIGNPICDGEKFIALFKTDKGDKKLYEFSDPLPDDAYRFGTVNVKGKIKLVPLSIAVTSQCFFVNDELAKK